MQKEPIIEVDLPTVGQRIAGRIVFSEGNGHWFWPGGKTVSNKAGYSRVYLFEKNVMLHQIVWEAIAGFPPPGRMYNKCGMQSCLNPAHWQVGLGAKATQMLPVAPVQLTALTARIAALLDAIAAEAQVPCRGCGNGLTVHERQEAEYLVQYGYGRIWAELCGVCLAMYRNSARAKVAERNRQVMWYARRGRPIAWIAERLIGAEIDKGIQQVVKILSQNGYTVHLEG